MTAEEEQYYDSIDDSEFESCRSFCNTKFQDADSDLEDGTKLEELVPFYTGNVEVDSVKNESKSNSSTNLKSKLKRRNNKHLLPTLERRKSRSYLTIFYAKSGLQSKSGVPESSRDSVTELSPKSCVSCDPEEKSSCYFDQDDSKGYEEQKSRQENQSIGYMPSSTSSSDSKLYSVSEIQLKTEERAKKNSGCGNKNTIKAKPVKVGELGGLGPNIAHEKLELLRKRQDYGRTVSQKNRLKIMESKVVQKLKEEIRESNKL